MTTPPSAVTIASPCVRNCCLDEHNICMGCGRTLQEITRWGPAPAHEKLEIVARSRERTLQRRNKFGDGGGADDASG